MTVRGRRRCGVVGALVGIAGCAIGGPPALKRMYDGAARPADGVATVVRVWSTKERMNNLPFAVLVASDGVEIYPYCTTYYAPTLRGVDAVELVPGTHDLTIGLVSPSIRFKGANLVESFFACLAPKTAHVDVVGGHVYEVRGRILGADPADPNQDWRGWIVDAGTGDVVAGSPP